MGKSGSGKNNYSKYKVYLDERKLLIHAEYEESRLFDKAILALTAGAFGLSLTFIRQIVPTVEFGTVWMLICAWTGFCISLLITLISFLTSQSACSKQREILEAEYFDNHGSQSEKTHPKNKPAIWTKRLNKISISAFIIGVIFLATFSISNLSTIKEDAMSNKKEGKIEKGFVPQKPPKKPEHVEQEEGFVPPTSPKKPPAKPSKEKK